MPPGTPTQTKSSRQQSHLPGAGAAGKPTTAADDDESQCPPAWSRTPRPRKEYPSAKQHGEERSESVRASPAQLQGNPCRKRQNDLTWTHHRVPNSTPRSDKCQQTRPDGAALQDEPGPATNACNGLCHAATGRGQVPRRPTRLLVALLVLVVLVAAFGSTPGAVPPLLDRPHLLQERHPRGQLDGMGATTADARGAF